MEKFIRQAQSVQQAQSSVRCVLYNEELRGEWDNFIESTAINGTFLHSRKFYDHNPSNAIDDSSLVFYKENKIIAVFPAVIYRTIGNVILHSHLRAAYGGFVVGGKTGVGEAINIVEQTIAFAKKRGVHEIIIRNPFHIYQTKLCDETDYAMWFHGFQIKSRELEISIPICGNLSEVKSQYHKSTSRNVKKGAGSVQVTPFKDFTQFWVILEKCLVNRFGQTQGHSLASINKLKENLGDDRVLLFAAFYNGELIGGILAFNFSKLVLSCQFIASDILFQHLKPVHVLVDYVIGWGNNHGYKYLNLGTANEDSGKIDPGLFRFKESFGGRGVLRETMYLNL